MTLQLLEQKQDRINSGQFVTTETVSVFHLTKNLVISVATERYKRNLRQVNGVREGLETLDSNTSHFFLKCDIMTTGFTETSAYTSVMFKAKNYVFMKMKCTGIRISSHLLIFQLNEIWILKYSIQFQTSSDNITILEQKLNCILIKGILNTKQRLAFSTAYENLQWCPVFSLNQFSSCFFFFLP